MNIYGKIAGKADLSKNPIDEPGKKSESAASQTTSLEDNGSISKLESDADQANSLESLTDDESESELEQQESLELHSVEEEEESEEELEAPPGLFKSNSKPLPPQEIKDLADFDVEIKPPQKIIPKAQESELNVTFNPNSDCWNKTILATLSDEFEDKWTPLQSIGPNKEDAISKEIASKVFEPEDNWEGFIWRRKLARAKETQKLSKPKVPIFDQVKKCESEYKSKIAEDSDFVHHLLQSLLEDDVKEKPMKAQSHEKQAFFSFEDVPAHNNYFPKMSDFNRFNFPPNTPSFQFSNQQRLTILPQGSSKKSAHHHPQLSMNQHNNFKPSYGQNVSGSPTFFSFNNYSGPVNGQQFTNFL